MSISLLQSNLRVTGSNIIFAPNLSGIGGTQILRSGNFVLISGGAGGGAGDVTYAELTGASGALQYQINNISTMSNTGDERIISTAIPTGVDSYFISWTPNFSSIPVSIVSTLEVTGSLLFTTNISNRTVSGYTALFSNIITENGVTINTYARLGAYVAAGERIGNTPIPTGVDSYFIGWTPNYPSAPTMIQATLGVTGDAIYGINIRNRTISGYTAIFSDLIAESGVYVNTFARF